MVALKGGRNGRREGGRVVKGMEQGKKEMGDKILNRDGERGLYV